MAMKHASSDDVMSSLEEMLQCTICMESYKDPRCLDCQHSFCLSCIKKNSSRDNKVHCPTCRVATSIPTNNGIDGLRKDFKISRLVEIVQQSPVETDKVCAGCDGLPAVSLCRTCSDYFCQCCGDTHTEFPIFREHSVTSLTEANAVCNYHGRELQYFCKSCSLCICNRCFLKEHRDHDVLPLSDHVTPLRLNLGAVLENALSLRENGPPRAAAVCSELLAASQVRARPFMQALDALQARLQQLRESRDDRLTSQTQERCEDVRRVMAPYSAARELMDIVIKEARALQDGDNPLQMLHNAQGVCDRLETVGRDVTQTGADAQLALHAVRDRHKDFCEGLVGATQTAVLTEVTARLQELLESGDDPLLGLLPDLVEVRDERAAHAREVDVVVSAMENADVVLTVSEDAREVTWPREHSVSPPPPRPLTSDPAFVSLPTLTEAPSGGQLSTMDPAVCASTPQLVAPPDVRREYYCSEHGLFCKRRGRGGCGRRK